MVLTKSLSREKHWTAPNFSALGVDGTLYSLDAYKEKKGVAIIFTCNHCPFAVAARPIIQHLSKTYPEIGFLCISSNDATLVPEDSYENMKLVADSMGFGFPYLYDKDQSIAKSYKAQCTPDNYLFKNTGDSFELFYHGRLTDNRKDPSMVKQKDFEDHIKRLLNNEIPSSNQKHSIGCSIKRK